VTDDELRTASEAFWRWFETVATELEPAKASAGPIGELDRRLRALGDVGWEIGPGVEAEYALVIWPGSIERLATTKAIVAFAPTIEDWEFLPAKPPKQWLGRFNVPDEDGDDLELDCSTWRYVMLEDPDGATEMLVHAPEIATYPEERRRWFAEIALDGLLGEEQRLRTITYVDVVATLDEEQEDAARPMSALQRPPTPPTSG